jgi:hypothetical protein
MRDSRRCRIGWVTTIEIEQKHQLTMTFRCPAEVVYANNLCGLKVSAYSNRRRRQDGSHPDEVQYVSQIKLTVVRPCGEERIRLRGYHDPVSEYCGSYASVLQQLLGREYYPTYQRYRSDDERRRVIEGKVRFSTYHACKGLEAHCMFGSDGLI